MLKAFNFLPWIAAKDERSLGDIIDYLYFTYYEGAGGGTLRFLTENGGWLDQSDCKAIFHIKSLRNKYLRHDPDHGDQRTIDRAWRDIHTTLEELGLSGLPTLAAEFRLLHERLLADLEEFLICLKRALAARNG